jgi:ATP-dependent protease ClpP protease subunit
MNNKMKETGNEGFEEIVINQQGSKNFLLVQEFSEQSFAKFLVEFEIVKNNVQHLVPIYIDSYGGEVDVLMGMISIIKASPVPVMTIVNSKAMSCGAVLAAAGTKGLRYFSPYARGMIHSISGGAEDKLLGLKLSIKEMESLNNRVFSLLDSCAGKNKNFFKNLLEKHSDGDLFYDAKKAKTLGLADHIGIPVISVDRQVNTMINVTKIDFKDELKKKK